MPHSFNRSRAAFRAGITDEPLEYAHMGIGRHGELFDSMHPTQRKFRAHLARHLFNTSRFPSGPFMLHSSMVTPSPQHGDLLWFSPNPALVADALVTIGMPWRQVSTDETFGGIVLVDALSDGVMRILHPDRPSEPIHYEDGYVSMRTRCRNGHLATDASPDAEALLAALISRYPLQLETPLVTRRGAFTAGPWSAAFNGPSESPGLGSLHINLTGRQDAWSLWWDRSPDPALLAQALTDPGTGLKGVTLEPDESSMQLRYGSATLTLGGSGARQSIRKD